MMTRADVRILFARLRKQGFTARMNFMCCGSCASAALANELPKGAKSVFYHQQANERSFTDKGRNAALENVGLYLMWGTNNGPEEHELAVGVEIATAAVEDGFVVEWDGTQANCIRLLDPERMPTISELTVWHPIPPRARAKSAPAPLKPSQQAMAKALRIKSIAEEENKVEYLASSMERAAAWDRVRTLARLIEHELDLLGALD